MNFFILDLDPKLAAQFHCDKHVISQMKEGVQVLCTSLLHYGNEVPNNSSGKPYKEAYPNHPCTKWVIEGLLNYQWAWDLTFHLAEEAEYRFGGEYHILNMMREGHLPRTPARYPEPQTRTPFANATSEWLKSSAMWDNKANFGRLNAIDKYRLYYMMDKCHMTAVELGNKNIHWKSEHTLGSEFSDKSIWTKRGAPKFMSERFYLQQCEFFGIRPAELIRMELNPEHPDSIKLKQKMDKKIGKKATGQVGTKTKRVTKADVLVDIRELIGSDACSGLLKLTLPHMQNVKLAASLFSKDIPSATMPEGRLKKPYVESVASIFDCEADFSKLTINELKEIISHFGG